MCYHGSMVQERAKRPVAIVLWSVIGGALLYSSYRLGVVAYTVTFDEMAVFEANAVLTVVLLSKGHRKAARACAVVFFAWLLL